MKEKLQNFWNDPDQLPILLGLIMILIFSFSMVENVAQGHTVFALKDTGIILAYCWVVAIAVRLKSMRRDVEDANDMVDLIIRFKTKEFADICEEDPAASAEMLRQYSPKTYQAIQQGEKP